MPPSPKWIEAGTPDAVPAEVAAATLKVRLRAVEYYLPLAAKNTGDDIEPVHQLRVSTRRTTAALKFYQEFVPRKSAQRMRDQLQRIRKAAGNARDLDVFARRLNEYEPQAEARRLLKRIEKLRRQAQKPIRRMHRQLCRSGRIDRRIRKLLRKTRRKGRRDAGPPMRFGDWAAEQFVPVLNRFVEAGGRDLTDIAALHQFRIEGKALRYTMELLGEAFPSPFRDALYPQVESLQEKLGQINDHAAAANRLRHWLAARTSRRERALLRTLLEETLRNLEQSRHAFLEGWSPSQLRDFRREFETLLIHRNGRPTPTSREGTTRAAQ